VVDLSLLHERLYRGAVDNQPVNQMFDIQADPVTYGSIEPNDMMRTRKVESPDPFFKNILYGSQREYRIVLLPKLSIKDVDHIIVNVPDGDPIFRRCELNGIFGCKPNASLGEVPEFIDTVQKCFSNWACRPRYSTDFDDPNWIEKSKKNREIEQVLFCPFARKITEAYWKIRSKNRDPELDDAIVNSVPPNIFISRVALYVGRLGFPIRPPF
jgi:hypothetical protein